MSFSLSRKVDITQIMNSLQICYSSREAQIAMAYRYKIQVYIYIGYSYILRKSLSIQILYKSEGIHSLIVFTI